jgi:hypothetical protein
MVTSILILIASAALLLFYVQATCERILGRTFENLLLDLIVEANRLEFLGLKQALTDPNSKIDFQVCRAQLENDCDALTHLLKHAANGSGRFSARERLLTLYFRALSVVVNVGGRPVLLKMTAVLEYFANVVGERIQGARFANVLS